MSAPTTTEQIAAVMVDLAAEQLVIVAGHARAGNPAAAHAEINEAIRQLDAARRMLT